MQRAITSKALSLMLALLLSLGVLSAALIASPNAWAKTVGNYDINFATGGTTGGETFTENGITATAVIGEPVSSFGGNDYVEIIVSFSGTASATAAMVIDLTGELGSGGPVTAGNVVFVLQGKTSDKVFLYLGIPTTETIVKDLELSMTAHPANNIFTLNQPNTVSLNGVDFSVDFGWVNNALAETNDVWPDCLMNGTATSAGKYTINLSSATVNCNLTGTIPVAAGEVVSDRFSWFASSASNAYSFEMPDKNIDDFIFTVTFTPSGGSSGGSSSGGSSGGGSSSGSRTTPSAPAKSDNVAANGSVDSGAISSDLKKAMSGTAGNGSLDLNIKNAQSISPSVLKSLADEARRAGKNVVINADTTDANGNVIGRLYVEPSKLAGLTADLKLGISTDPVKTFATKTTFEKHFENKVAVIQCEQQGSFGAKLQMAVKVDLSQLNTKSLAFYSFDPKTNSYTQITDANYFIDKNGYLHFTTDMGNNIVITDSPLKPKK